MQYSLKSSKLLNKVLHNPPLAGRALTVFLLLLTLLPASAWELPAQCQQLVIGTAKSWNSSYVSVILYEKKGNSWKAVTPPVTGRLGRNGLAWARGIQPYASKPHLKREGDGRAPAGVFLIGQAFGSHKSIKKKRKLAYTPMALN